MITGSTKLINMSLVFMMDTGMLELFLNTLIGTKITILNSWDSLTWIGARFQMLVSDFAGWDLQIRFALLIHLNQLPVSDANIQWVNVTLIKLSY